MVCKREIIDEEEARRAAEGKHDNYMSMGSVAINPKRLRLLNGYRVMLRLMSFLPPWAKKPMLRLKLYKIFWMAPFRVFISVLDLMIDVRDKDATTYVRNYVWWFRKRFDKDYHLYMFKKRKNFEELPDGPFELPVHGYLDKNRPRAGSPYHSGGVEGGVLNPLRLPRIQAASSPVTKILETAGERNFGRLDPSRLTFVRNACDLCGKRDGLPYRSATFLGRVFTFVKCPECGLVYQARIRQIDCNFTDFRRRFGYKNQHLAVILEARSWRTRWVKRNWSLSGSISIAA